MVQLPDRLRAKICLAAILAAAPISGPGIAFADAPTPDGGTPNKDMQTRSFSVTLADPAFPEKPTRTETVTQREGADGFPLGYSMHIITEVCTDNKCKLVEATLHWNALGYFERLECAKDKPLTKKEHVPFDDADYEKLDRILKDPNSILGQQSLAFLANPPPADALDVDGWSGATPATVEQSVVKDAAYTTWVMWRWANGEIVPKLCEITEQSCSVDFLKKLLRSEDRRDVDYALKYVREHHAADETFVEDVFRILEIGDREHISLALEFLKQVVKDEGQLHPRLIAAACRMKPTYSPMVLAHFSSQPNLPASTLEALSGVLDQLPYFQVHLILRLFDQRSFFSEQVEADVAELLDQEDFFIARRAFEHLVEQELSAETRQKVDAFREQHRDRL